MASKKELAEEIALLRKSLKRVARARTELREKSYHEFIEALTSIERSSERRVRVIAPNGTILWATCADLRMERSDSGLTDTTMTLHPEPNR